MATSVFRYASSFTIYLKIDLDKIHKRLTAKTLEMIRKERRGEVIDSSILQKVISSYVEIGRAVSLAYSKSQKDINLKNYEERFLEAFLADTGAFYNGESQECYP